MTNDSTDGWGEEMDDAGDRAVAARLAALRGMPVDTNRLDAALRARLPRQRKPNRFLLLPRSVRAVAASLLVLSGVAVAILLFTSGGPALASADQMARFHQEIVSGQVPVMQVDSIEAANRMLGAQSPGAPALPQVPREHVMACCMKSVHDKKMACLLFRDEGVPITLAVANASDMKLPPAQVVSRGGASYRVQAVGDLHMVMTERDGRWLCLIGQLPAERLMDVAAQVRF